MSLIMFDGFDDNLALKNKWTSAQNVVQHADYGRTGEGLFLDHQNGAGIAQLVWTLSAADEDDVLVLGMALKLHDLHAINPTDEIIKFASDGGGTTHMIMRSSSGNGGGQLQFYRGPIATFLGACPFGEGLYRYLEIKVKLHDATGYLVVHVDGQEVLNLTNIDTKNGGTKAVFDTIIIRAERITGIYPVIYIDDLYLLNEQGARNNDFLNDCRVENLLPNAVGNYSQFTSEPVGDNYAAVDENPPNDADYVESDTGGHDDSYNFPALSGVGAVAGVQVHLYGTVDDAGTRGVKALTRQGGADSLGDEKTFNATPQVHTQMWEDNPDDAAQWAVADVDGAEFGLEVV